jgi:hypothetical protein
MTEQRLNLPAGEYTLPQLRFATVDGSPQPDVVFLVFQAKDERPGHRGELSISVPVSTLDATALLDTLQQLQGKGLLPVVPLAPTTKQ